MNSNNFSVGMVIASVGSSVEMVVTSFVISVEVVGISTVCATTNGLSFWIPSDCSVVLGVSNASEMVDGFASAVCID